MKRILVIEDEKRIATLLQKGLTEFGFEVSIAFDGDTGKRLAIFQIESVVLCFAAVL